MPQKTKEKEGKGSRSIPGTIRFEAYSEGSHSLTFPYLADLIPYLQIRLINISSGMVPHVKFMIAESEMGLHGNGWSDTA